MEFSVSLVFCQGKMLFCFDRNRYTYTVIVVYSQYSNFRIQRSMGNCYNTPAS